MYVLDNSIIFKDGRTVADIRGHTEMSFWNMHPTTEMEAPVQFGAGCYDIGSIGAFSSINGGNKSNRLDNSAHVDAESIGRFALIAGGVRIGLPAHSTTFVSPHPAFRYNQKAEWCRSFMNQPPRGGGTTPNTYRYRVGKRYSQS